MKRVEVLSIAAALSVGSLVGFGGARWRAATSDPHRETEVAAQPVAVVASGGRLKGAAEVRSAGEELGMILDDPVRSRRQVALDRYCDGLDLEAVRRAVLALPGGVDAKTWELRGRLFNRWAELEPEAAAAYARDTLNAPLNGVLDVWAGHDREAAKRFVAGLKNRDQLLAILPTFTGTLAESDFEDALRFAQALPADQFNNSIRLAFYHAGRKNAAATVERALAMPEGEARGSALSAAVDVWVEQDPQAAMAWVRQREDTPVDRNQTLGTSALQRWSSGDPEAVARFVQNLPEGKLHDEGIKLVAMDLGFSDPEAGLSWVQNLPEGPAKTEALSRLLGQWSYDDPAAALAFVARQPANPAMNEVVENAGLQWASADPAAALAWAQKQSEAVEKRIAPQALGRLAADNPEGAVTALGSLRGATTRAVAITAIAKSWADLDVVDAANWVLALPPADANNATLQDVITTATGRDPAAMAGWIETLQGRPQRDVAVEAFAKAAQQYDPTSAATWANTLTDANKRKPLVQKIVRDYANYDAPGARAWVLGQNFEASEQTALLGQIDKADQRK